MAIHTVDAHKAGRSDGWPWSTSTTAATCTASTSAAANQFAGRVLTVEELETLKTLLRRVIDGLTADESATQGRASVMTRKRLFVLNAAIAVGYGIVLLVATNPILDVYGIAPNPEGVYMARWFGLGLLGIGLTTWLARDAAESETGRVVARALAVTYALGVVLALWGMLFGPFNALGWIAVALNLLLGSGFAYAQRIRAAGKGSGAAPRAVA